MAAKGNDVVKPRGNLILAHVVRCQVALDEPRLCCEDWDEVVVELQARRELHHMRVEQATIRQALILQQQYDKTEEKGHYGPLQPAKKVKQDVSKLTRAQLFLLMDFKTPTVLIDDVFKYNSKGRKW